MKIVLSKVNSAVTPAHTEEVELEGEYILVGRTAGQLRLDDPRCSKYQAIFYQAMDGRLRLRDLDSTNGTFLNGESTFEAALEMGDKIRIGKITLEVLDYEPVRIFSALDTDQSVIEIEPQAIEGNPEVMNEGTAKFSGKASNKGKSKDLLDYINLAGSHGQVDLKALKK